MVVAIDVGGSTARVAAFADGDKPTIIKRRRLPVVNDFDQDMAVIEQAVRAVAGDQPTGIGVSVAGRLDQKHQSLLGSPNLPAWVGQPLHDRLQQVFGCPVIIHNDTFSAAYGEATERREQAQDFWFIIWGTGIGSSLVRYQPVLTVAPTVSGHQQVIDSNGPICACGKRGCWEALAGGASIEKNYGKTPSELSNGEWQKVERDFARGLSVTLERQPTDLVVVGGGVALGSAERLAGVANELRRLRSDTQLPKIELAILGDDAGLYGARALLLMEKS